MSKESYIRGFCKAAETHGVDPYALSKYAQQYKTEGYTPDFMGTRDDERINIPVISFDGRVIHDRMPLGWAVVNPWDLKKLPDTPEERARRILDPRHLAWQQAHTNALSKVVAPMRSARFPDDAKIPDDIKKALEKIYHDTMKSTTSAVPARVSAPVKK